MEIEIRAYIDSFENIQDKLKKMNIKKDSEVFIADKWFCHYSCTCFEDTRMSEPGSYGLRLREEKNANHVKYELNCKVIKDKEDHNAFYEYETEISDIVQTKKILQSIGFSNFCTIKKQRTSYKVDNIIINLEDIENFEPVIELEVISDRDVLKHKQQMLDLLKKLGIKKDQIIEKSITYDYMKRFAFKGSK